MIEIREFSKSYSEFMAVHRLNLSIARGDTYGFIGPNGAGKSTTIRFLATLLRPTTGKATIDGFDVVREVREVRRRIGYMPDSFGVFEGMRVWEFLDFFAAAYGIQPTKRRGILADVLALVDLEGKRNSPVEGLSRGMKQRLCLAKTLLHDPPVLILDEPASGLDPRARLEMKELLRELRRMGKTILISSHILSELADMCNKVAVIERGRLLAAGSITEILAGMRSFRRYRVRALDDLAAIETVAGRLSATRALRRAEVTGAVPVVEIDLDGDDQVAAQLLESLVQGGVRVLAFEEVPPNLEDLFMHVTAGEVQ